MAFASMIIPFLMMFIFIESISLGLFVSGITVSIIFFVKSKKEKIGNKVALPIVLITLGISGLIPSILIILGLIFN